MVNRFRWLICAVYRRSRTVFFVAALVMGITVALLAALGFSRSTLRAPAPTPLLMDRDGRFLAQITAPEGKGYGYWTVEPLPERVAAATLALEDRRFHHHPGVDPAAMLRALIQNLKSGERISGASTIAMQVARMQHPGRRTYLNKAVESAAALFMTLRYGRETVLKHYLRLVPYGNQSHGIAHAARLYLDKPAADLSWAEIAFLSAIPQAPGLMNPFSDAGKARAVARGKRILSYLHEHQVITDVDFSLAISQIKKLTVPEKKHRPREFLHAILYLSRMLKNDPALVTEGNDPLIVTSLDPRVQRIARSAAANFIQQWRHAGASHIAAVVVKRETMEVLAWLGSTRYGAADAGAVDFCRVERSPGSALKPFIYGLALERGVITPATILDDLQQTARGVENADSNFLGPLLPRTALANSRNVPAVNLLEQTGLDETFYLFRRLGLHDGRRPAEYFGSCMAIGCLPVTLEKTIRAYGALANDGVLRELSWQRRETPAPGVRVISQSTARQITLFLADPMARMPAFPRMGTLEFPFAAALKTGTSQGYRDAWTLAYSRQYLVGVWVGRADHRPMNKLGGAGSAAVVAQKILNALHPERRWETAPDTFPPPEGYQPVEICALTGKRATDLTPKKIIEWFPPEQIPRETASPIMVPIDARNQLRAGAWTPRNHLQVRRFLDLPSRYHEWAEAHGIPMPPVEYSPLDRPTGTETHDLAAAAVPPGTPVLKGIAPARVAIASPDNGLKMIMNPEMPAALNRLTLRAVVEPPVPQVLWMVDGAPFQVADFPYTIRWPVNKGKHTFQALLPFRDEKSAAVTVMVE